MPAVILNASRDDIVRPRVRFDRNSEYLVLNEPIVCSCYQVCWPVVREVIGAASWQLYSYLHSSPLCVEFFERQNTITLE
ncbi:hypothetical protein Y032_0063g3435 [Ancylostoma ceylanicum]|uniref:Uncharacterized protein n=1 Tax=Ancylostoma ceylanicum TaxID=53326 RepID=A0A016U1E2_9BILA|nr:hypothetical protein Y032_0063g3435 [Ancylostoma ceylanicum]